MSFVTNILTPLIQLIFYIIFFLGFCFLVYHIIKNFCPNWRWFFKYKIFKRKFKEEHLDFCKGLFDADIERAEIKKQLLLSGRSIIETDEIIYIYDFISKQLKGGVKNGG